MRGSERSCRVTHVTPNSCPACTSVMGEFGSNAMTLPRNDRRCCSAVTWLCMFGILSRLGGVESFVTRDAWTRREGVRVLTLHRPISSLRPRNDGLVHTPELDRLLVRPRTLLSSTPDDEISRNELFNGRTTLALVGGQSSLILVALAAASLAGTPNFGFGPGIDFSSSALSLGTLYVAPLVIIAVLLDFVEDRFQALQDVSKATQRSVLALMGGTFRPLFALLISGALGLAAGFGEEMLFRGVFQYEVANQFGTGIAVATSSVVFGLLHAVTPLYAILATIASVYFGSIYIVSDNLAVPITCHTVYDIGALFYAHWTVCQLSPPELEALRVWEGPRSENTDSLR